MVLAVFVFATSVAIASSVKIGNTTYSVANSLTTYDYIYPSNSSWDSGSSKINIVDWLLNDNAGNNTYTLINGNLTVPNPVVETWFTNGVSSVILEEIAGSAGSNT